MSVARALGQSPTVTPQPDAAIPGVGLSAPVNKGPVEPIGGYIPEDGMNWLFAATEAAHSQAKFAALSVTLVTPRPDVVFLDTG